jgi:hypothetical protein
MRRYEFMCNSCKTLFELTIDKAGWAKVGAITSIRKGRKVTRRLRTKTPKI